MKRLNDVELAVMKGLNLKPNVWIDRDCDLPTATQVLIRCIENGYGHVVNDADAAQMVLSSLEYKLTNYDDDFISLEDVAIWILSETFSEEQLYNMTDTEVETWLKDWKYFFGFRKCDGWGMTYKNGAIEVHSGTLIQNPESDDIEYIHVH